jgi:hypothetical protein
MEPTITYNEPHEKMNALLRALLYRSQMGIPVEDLESMLFYLKPAELSELCEQLFSKGIVGYAIGPFGLVLKLTEMGMEWILNGGHTQREKTAAIIFGRPYISDLKQPALVKYVLPGVFCLALLACCLLCR